MTLAQEPTMETDAPAPEGSARREAGRRIGAAAFLATTLFAAQLYVAPADWFPALAPLRLAMLLSATGLSCLVLQRLLGNKPLVLGWRTAFLFLYLGTAALSPMWSLDRPTSISAAIEVSKHFLFFLAVTNTATTPGRIRTALLLFAAAAIVPGIGTYVHYANGELLVEGFRGRWYGVMADPNHDAMALVAAVPLLLMLLVSGKGVWQRLVGLVGAAGCLAGIVATHSRGGSVGLAVAVVVWALLAKRKAIAMAAVTVAALGVVLFAPASFWERNQSIAGYQDDESVHGRVQAWHVAGRAFAEHPMLGVGEQAFLKAWDNYAPLDAGVNRYVAHNLFLEVLAELGLVGFTGLVGFLLISLWSAWRGRNGALGVESRAIFASIIGYVVCQQFSGYSLSWFLYSLCGFAACIDWVSSAARAKAAIPAPAPPEWGVRLQA
jgi:putative inorganic carbon (HCO3(-)) transporter